jgi:hypothetical protein
MGRRLIAIMGARKVIKEAIFWGESTKQPEHQEGSNQGYGVSEEKVHSN